MAAERTGRSYRLEPLDSSGVFLGLGVAQCVLVGGGITMGVLRAIHSSLELKAGLQGRFP